MGARGNKIVHKLTFVAAIFLALTGCASDSLSTRCEVPSMYLQVYGGLIDPTWEPEGEMRAQIEGLSEDDLVCWYGNLDGSVTAKVNPTPRGGFVHLFRKINESWVLVDSIEEVIVH